MKDRRRFRGLITHSFGGLAAAYALTRRAELIDFPPQQLILIACPINARHLLDAFIHFTALPRRAAKHFTARIEQRLQGETWQAFDIAQLRAALPAKLLICHDQHDRDVPLAYSPCQRPELAQDEQLITQHQGHFRILRHPQLLQRCLRKL